MNKLTIHIVYIFIISFMGFMMISMQFSCLEQTMHMNNHRKSFHSIGLNGQQNNMRSSFFGAGDDISDENNMDGHLSEPGASNQHHHRIDDQVSDFHHQMNIKSYQKPKVLFDFDTDDDTNTGTDKPNIMKDIELDKREDQLIGELLIDEKKISKPHPSLKIPQRPIIQRPQQSQQPKQQQQQQHYIHDDPSIVVIDDDNDINLINEEVLMDLEQFDIFSEEEKQELEEHHAKEMRSGHFEEKIIDDEDDGELEEEQIEKDSDFTYVEYVMPHNGNSKNHSSVPEIRLKPQVKGPKAFKAAGTKFSSLFDGWHHAGWIRKLDTAYLTSVSLILTKPITVVPGSTGKMISQISHSSCIGGSKGAQLRCRVSFAAKQGCAFQDLGISPQQYNMWSKRDCENFFKVAIAPSNKYKLWIGKVGGSYHGKYMTIYKGLTKTIKSKYGTCKMDRSTGGGYIMQEYISNPALVGGYKFDVRTFMLIASTKPFLVFYHDGFARKGGTKYSNNTDDKLAHITNHESQADNSEHFWGFSRLGSVLHQESGFAKDYMHTRFRNLAKHATNYVFQSARTRLQRRTGAFMLFGLDWMVDTKGHLHLLEANGNPTIRHYPGTDLTPAIWRDMASLLTAIHMDTNKLTDLKVAKGFHWNGWDLIFSEPEEKVTSHLYNPCEYKNYVKGCSDPNLCPMW